MIGRESSRKRSKRSMMINGRSSRRSMQNCSRSLGAHQRRQLQRPYKQNFSTNLTTTITTATTAAASSSLPSDAAADISTNLVQLPQQSKQTFETITGYGLNALESFFLKFSSYLSSPFNFH